MQRLGVSYRSWPAILLVAVLAARCAPVDSPALPPSGVFSASVTFPPAGTRWTSRKTSYDARADRTSTETVTWTVLGGGTYEGKPVYSLWDGAFVHLHDRSTTNWIALLDKRWTPVNAVDPDNGWLAPPLWVGKRWTARFTHHEYKAGRTFYDMTAVLEVTAYEDVEVPAGTFKAFRIERRQDDDRLVIRRLTYWYAPSLAVTVKVTTDGNDPDWGRNYRVRSTTELLSYVRAEAGAAVPVEVIDGRRVAHVTINRTERVLVVLDDAVSGSGLTAAALARLGLPVSQHEPGGTVRLAAVQLGPATAENLDVVVLHAAPGPPVVDGVLGADFMGRFRIVFNEDRREMRLEPR